MTAPEESFAPKRQAASWSTHALLTYGALKSFHDRGLDDGTRVTPIEDFLQYAGPGLGTIMGWYWGLLDKKSGSARPSARPPETFSDEAEFLAALHLNPKTRLHYVKLRPPEEIDPDSPHDVSREGPPGDLYQTTDFGTEITGREILFTYADEPDWGMDQDLFAVENHPYGDPPFGITHGISSQGPFHMAFLHENPLLLRVLPALGRTFLPERIRVFFALADLALAKGQDYWGRRFTAWAMHYLQDATSPYHARAFPPAVIPTLRELLSGTDGRSRSEKIRDILKMHHILFEGVVHLLLNEAVKKNPNHPFLSALASGNGPTEDLRPFKNTTRGCTDPDTDLSIEAASKTPANVAAEIDAVMMALFSRCRRDIYRPYDGTRFLEAGLKAFTCGAEDKKALFTRFLNLTSTCLSVTGTVTRYAANRTCRLTQLWATASPTLLP
ncbi:MAG: hypothetical protein RDU20_04480 [Desulfomonilaceae bacterium]|nr:hypothetical protein [Desulfomonilaceae bacterium]